MFVVMVLIFFRLFLLIELGGCRVLVLYLCGSGLLTSGSFVGASFLSIQIYIPGSW